MAAAAPARAQDEPIAERQAAFEAWLVEFRPQAVAAGVSAATVERELAGLAYNPRVVTLDNAQPDRSSVSRATFAGYLRTRLNDARTNQGIRLRADLAATLSSIETTRGVPAELLLAFWGMETAYGQRTGNFDLVRALATLAF
ncbi:MAG: lytic murein transglycosylase, partial [Alphaproteobacteria bacterium]|nr:lytic murein transglycosylase [Alphaproteobacteria bacterium]